MSILNLSDGVRYVKKCDDPLSAEAFIIDADGITIIFDVGASDEAFREIGALEGEKIAVLSHFHADHSENLKRLNFDRLFVGGFAHKKFGGEAVTEDIYLSGAHIFPLPSSHAKGCLGLECRGLAFLGDGAYAGKIPGGHGYNAGGLQETIKTLEGLQAENFVLSHSEPLIRPAKDVIGELRQVLTMRGKGENYICV